MSTDSSLQADLPTSARAGRGVTLGLWLLVAAALAFFLAFAVRYFGPVDEGHFGPRVGVLRLHIVAGALALFFGPFQFMEGIRRRRLSVHRLMGRTYLVGILIGGLTGLYLSFFANGGLPGKVGFAGLSVAWLATSGMAFTAIRMRRVAEHREWMIRSYVVTLAFVWVRLALGAGFASGGNEAAVFGVAAWASWAVPLLVVEVVFGIGRLRSAR